MSNLDTFAKRHDEMCSCALMCIDDLKYCDCGYAERVAELQELHDARDAAQSIIQKAANGERTIIAAAAWLKQFGTKKIGEEDDKKNF
jgi:hypothetical protein